MKGRENEKKILIISICMLVMNLVYLLPVSAENVCVSYQTAEANEHPSVIPYADVIVKKYRVKNGILQYRRWNETEGCWVDPYWIDM